MAATTRICETNGTTGSPSETDSITNSNMGSIAAPNLVAADYPIAAGTNSYEKYQRLEVVSMGGSSAVKNIKVWRTGSLSGSDAHVTNARTSSYGGAETFTTPVNTTSTKATQTMPSSEPGSANLGIGGSLTGQLTSAGKSDYLIHQIQVNSSTTAGASTTMNYKYEEVA